MWQRLLEILEPAQPARILVVGDFMLDHYLYGDAERISPEAPVPVLRVVREEDALGGAGSVVADITALGATAVCLGATGRDLHAQRLRALLQSASANTEALIEIPGRPTTRKTRLIGLAQHRHRQQIIRIDEESTDPIDPQTAQTLLARAARLIEDCHVVCIEDYNKGIVTAELARGIFSLARAQKIPVLVDPAATRDYSRYAGATAITPNRTETEKLIGLRLPDIDAVRAAAPKIHAACHADYALITLDVEGAALIGPDGRFEHVPTKPRDVYDVTGAGDAVLAALAVALAAGADFREALALANIAGGLEVEKFGCVPVRRDEMIAEILLEHHKSIGKLRALDQLLPELARQRQLGKKIAFTNGCFDLLHAGHAASFAFCKQHADLLVVGLNSDESVRRQSKGAGRPIVPLEQRAALLAALTDVDYIVPFDDDTPESLISKIVPEVLIKGRDWEGRPIAGQSVVEAAGGRVILAPLVPGLSTSILIERIRRS